MSFRQRQVLALVPGRGGSKGIYRKNLRIVRGKPLIEHSIQAALGSTVVDSVYVSSDDDEILKVANSMGVNTLKRPEIAASDSAPASMVVFDFISRLPPSVVREDPYLVFLQPTSPLRTSEHIDRAFCEMEAKGEASCLSVVPLKRLPYKAFTLSKEGLLQSLFDEVMTNTNRQALPVTYYPNGAIYIFPLSEFIRKGGFPSNGSLPFVMSEKESIDIDSEDDIALIEKQ